jgi:hypothetical protein
VTQGGHNHLQALFVHNAAALVSLEESMRAKKHYLQRVRVPGDESAESAGAEEDELGQWHNMSCSYTQDPTTGKDAWIMNMTDATSMYITITITTAITITITITITIIITITITIPPSPATLPLPLTSPSPSPTPGIAWSEP